MDRRKIDILFSAILIIASLFILTSNNLVQGGIETALGSMFLPRIVAVFVIIFAGTIGIQSLSKIYKRADLGETERIDTDGFVGIGIYILIFITYGLIVPYVGFLLATPFVMFGIAALLRGRSWFAMAALSVIAPIVIYYATRELLRVYLPAWSLT